MQRHVNTTIAAILENLYRIKRLALLAPQQGALVEGLGTGLFEMIHDFTTTKKLNIDELRHMIDEFNRAVRDAHSEMIATAN